MPDGHENDIIIIMLKRSNGEECVGTDMTLRNHWIYLKISSKEYVVKKFNSCSCDAIKTIVS